MDNVLSVFKFRWQNSGKIVSFAMEAGPILKTLEVCQQLDNAFRMVFSTAQYLFSSFPN